MLFQWRDVSCSIKCGAEYFRRIEESRKEEENIGEGTRIDVNNKGNEDDEIDSDGDTNTGCTV